MYNINFNLLSLSYHCQSDRMERIEFIKNYVGFGQPLKEVYYANCFHYLTDTGVMIIVNAEKQKIITTYLVDAKEAARIYKGKIPKFLQRKIDYNFSKGYVRDRWMK